MFSNERSLGYIVCRKLSPLKPLKKEISTGTNLFELLSSFLWPLTPFLVNDLIVNLRSHDLIMWKSCVYLRGTGQFIGNHTKCCVLTEASSWNSTRDCVAFVMYILSNSTHHFHFHDQNMSVFHREKSCYVSKENFPYTCTKKLQIFVFDFLLGNFRIQLVRNNILQRSKTSM